VSGHWIGFVFLGVVAMRAALFYWGQPALVPVAALLGLFGLLYALERPRSTRLRLPPALYFPVQAALLVGLALPRPFLDMPQLLYAPLALQAMHTLSRRPFVAWAATSAALLTAGLVAGMGWLEGLALALNVVAATAFLVSYVWLSARLQGDQEESQQLLAELQQAHQKLEEHAGRAEALAAARERNRLARELHDSVSQSIFAVTLTSQAARLLLAREPARVPELLDRLQEMTAAGLARLRSLIAELRPPA
jgi:signal transduction histidine kinase